MRLPLPAIVVVCSPCVVLASSYSFQTIAVNNSNRPVLATPSINDAGDIAFLRYSYGSPVDSIQLLAGNEHTLRVVADAPRDVGSILSPVIGNNGFTSFLTTNGITGQLLPLRAVLAGNGSGLRIIADDLKTYYAFGSPSQMNSVGDVVFSAVVENDQRLCRGNLNGSSEIIELGTNVAGFDTPSLSESGIIAFTGTSSGPARNQAVFKIESGHTVKVAEVDSIFVGFRSYAPVNSSGTVLFGGLFRAGGEGIFTNGKGSITKLADTSGPYAGFWGGWINDAGQIAFTAGLDSGGPGIFTGQDPLLDCVLAPGDILDGHVVRRAELGGLNRYGQMTALVHLDNGSELIIRIDPVPEPGTAVLFGFPPALLVWRSSTSRRPKARGLRFRA